VQADQASFRLRWMVKWDWPLVPDRLGLFYNHEMFPSVQNFHNFYYTSNSGLVLTVYKNFVTKFQLTYRYNNNPPPGIKPGDTLYVISLGYSFGK
jgi:putative salt-induced outer membrane protein YdiY